ncbi:MAG: cupin domain-containing protein [Lentisphaeraceae bacterium]|nr:cupin domain-containing protein [Lentisphaeraceae bacterium]
MKIHADLNQNTKVNQDDLPWVKSPQQGVSRKMIERDGAEVTRATSLVKYEAQSFFPDHTHDMGEEFLVLDGVFSDESGDFKSGTYVRNPWGTKHRPFSREGCTIFVKLRQMHSEDQNSIRVHHDEINFTKINDALEYSSIHSFGTESVAFVKAVNEFHWQSALLGGLEVFIINGEITSEKNQLPKNGWLRFAPNHQADFIIRENSLLLIKTGHLPTVTSSAASVNWTKILSTKES